MNSLAKLIAAIAVLIASVALAWIARYGVEIRHTGGIDAELSTRPMGLRSQFEITHYIEHE
jgi:hypothetical protein